VQHLQIGLVQMRLVCVVSAHYESLSCRSGLTHIAPPWRSTFTATHFGDQLDEVIDRMDAARTSAQDRADFLRTNGADVYDLSREGMTGGQ
jgi:hypothetical protein